MKNHAKIYGWKKVINVFERTVKLKCYSGRYKYIYKHKNKEKCNSYYPGNLIQINAIKDYHEEVE